MATESRFNGGGSLRHTGLQQLSHVTSHVTWVYLLRGTSGVLSYMGVKAQGQETLKRLVPGGARKMCEVSNKHT